MDFITRTYYQNYLRSCQFIDAKSLYRSYKMDLSILSDFNEDDLNEMMDLSKTYTGDGSDVDPVPVKHKGDYENPDFVVSNMCDGYEGLSKSNPHPISWATAIISAAETSLRKKGITDELSLDYLETCLLKNMEIEDRNVTDVMIQLFLHEYGLMTKEVYNNIDKEYLCQDTSANYRFTTEALSDINKSGLMNMIYSGDPVIALMALDLNSLRTVHSDVEHIYKGAAYQPTVYGVVYGYSMDNYWSVSMNVVPCENIRLHLPMTENDTDANYAGIAGFAFSLKVDLSPPGTIPLYLVMNYDTDPTTQSFTVYETVIMESRRTLYQETGKDGVSQTTNRFYVSPSYHYITLSDSKLQSWPPGVNLTVVFGETQIVLSIASGKSLEGMIHPTKGFIPVSEVTKISECSDIDTIIANSEDVKYLTFNEQKKCDTYSPTLLDISDINSLVGFGTFNYNYENVANFKADGMNNLEYLLFGYGSFGKASGGTFSVTNCPNLKVMYAESRAFAKYYNFVLSNLDGLEIIDFGIDGTGYNIFPNANLNLNGIL